MPIYTSSNGKIKIETTYGFMYLLQPFIILYKNWNNNIENKKIDNNIIEQEKIVIELLNNINNQEIQYDLRRLLLIEKNYNVKCDIIRKYNNIKYLSNINIEEIIKFAIIKNENWKK